MSDKYAGILYHHYFCQGRQGNGTDILYFHFQTSFDRVSYKKLMLRCGATKYVESWV